MVNTGTLTPNISMVQIGGAPSENILDIHTSRVNWSIQFMPSLCPSFIIQTTVLSSSSVLPGNCSGGPSRNKITMVPALLEQSRAVVFRALNILLGGWRGEPDEPWHEGPTPDSPAGSPFSVPSFGIIAKDQYYRQTLFSYFCLCNPGGITSPLGASVSSFIKK